MILIGFMIFITGARSRSSVIVSVQNCTGAPPADKTPDISPLPFSPPFHCEKRKNAPEKNSLRQRGDTGGEETCVNILVERTSKGGRTEENKICVPVMAPHLLRRYLQCQFFVGGAFTINQHLCPAHIPQSVRFPCSDWLRGST